MARDVTVQSDVPVRRYDYETESIIVADIGAGAEDATVEVLEDVVLVVVPGLEGDAQYELELPEEGVANTFITNGILTIEVNP